MMRFLVLVILILPGASSAADLFASAGRIEGSDGRAICSASLIAPDIIVTAAHCVSAESERALFFRLGSEPEGVAYPVNRIEQHPFFEDFGRYTRLRFDIALGRLSQPIKSSLAKPLTLGSDAVLGENLYIVSWPRGSGERPRQRRCYVIEGQISGVVTLGCRVRGGESGAPLMRLTENGVELVAILNSTSRQKGQSVALAADVRLRIPPLLDRLRNTP
ncbi:MAG: trypsin-like peptidase domain-containing protein [Pseudomonadota bacterium]